MEFKFKTSSFVAGIAPRSFETLSNMTVNARVQGGSEFIKIHDFSIQRFLSEKDRMSEGHRSHSRKQKSAYVVIGKCQNTRCAVVSEVHKHVIVGAAAETTRAKVHHASSRFKKWLDVWFHVLTQPAHLLITFPLALAESPLSTARKFCGVTFCQKQPIRSHKFLLETCLNAYEKHQNSRLPCSPWERLCIRQSRWACLSVSQGWGSWKH